MNHKHKVCIKAKKVYDWISRQVDVPIESISEQELNLLFDCLGPGQTLCQYLSGKKYETYCTLASEPVYTQEMKQHGGRKKVKVTLPNGEKVTLEKVKILIKGKVDVTIVSDANVPLCRSKKPVEFVTVQTFYLCAPRGTDLIVDVTDFTCSAETVCTNSFQQLDISISLCLDVQVEADVKLEIDGTFCHPRGELDINVADFACGDVSFPRQCPAVFPGDQRPCKD